VGAQELLDPFFVVQFSEVQQRQAAAAALRPIGFHIMYHYDSIKNLAFSL
jgi:hypothetical protein